MRQYLLTSAEMKRCDNNTIEKYHMPSLLLMERAALVTVEEIQRRRGVIPCKVLVVAGSGNNGGDGLAVGRLLMLQGYEVTFVLIGRKEKCTAETARQIEILLEYGARIFSTIKDREYDIVIDALFGIGLSRQVEGNFLEAVRWIDQCSAYVCSVDIPSGICADTGRIMGCAVHADLTVTYGFRKVGQFLYPGSGFVGTLVCRQMGIDEHSFLGETPYWYTHIGRDSRLLPARMPDGNKGTFGKALLIAGSSQTVGAAMMAAKSAFRVGTGMVKVVTAVENREALLQFVPEAMLLTDGGEALKEASVWADVILFGPGVGTDKRAQDLLQFVLSESDKPLVIDADGLNLLAQDKRQQEAVTDQGRHGRTIILTPHLGEFARLYGCTTAQAKECLTDYPIQLSNRLQCIIVCKDARTVVACPGGQQGYLNTTGNAGMATAGSGDVLAGMVTGLLAQGISGWKAAVAGVYLHGIAGDLAAEKETETAMTATDIIERIKDVVRLQQGFTEQDGMEREA